MASDSQFAAPKDGEASFWFACDATPLGLPGAPESGDSFAFRSPQGRRGLMPICVWHHSAGPTGGPRTWRRFRSSQPPRTARPHSDVIEPPLWWDSQEPATVSQFAAPRDGEVSF